MTKLPTTPSFRLDGRRAVVTGAGRGIGLALAAGLAEAGASVCMIARTGSEIEEGSALIEQRGGIAKPVELDITDLGAVSDFFATEPGFDILINNAGTNRPKPLTEVDEQDYDAVLGLNLKSSYFVTRACVDGMRRDGRSGSLIHISSQLGHIGGADRSLYCASKWAVEGLSKALAIELAPFGIRSNTIAPTFIETPLSRPFLADAQFRQWVTGKIKLGRVGSVEDLMGGALFLASDASALVTGTSLMIDGGWTAG